MEGQITKAFESTTIRTAWNEQEEEWYFSVVDVVGVLTESENPNNYWKVLKNRLKKEGSQLVTNCNQLKMQSSDGKFYKTDCMNTEQILRLVQSVPSKKAEPFKMWLIIRINPRRKPNAISDKNTPRAEQIHAGETCGRTWHFTAGTHKIRKHGAGAVAFRNSCNSKNIFRKL